MKTFAFLDVDLTLLYNEGINVTLIDALKSQGVTDIYLFTNMKMKEIKSIGVDGAPMSRYELVNFLVKKGLTVHGVITPADPSHYDESGMLYPVGTAYKNLYLQSYIQLKDKPLFKRDGKPNADSAIAHEADYYLREFEWDKASYFTQERCEMTDGIKTVDIPQLCIYVDDKKTEVICPDKASLVRELTRVRENGVTYDVRRTAGLKKATITKTFSDNKALMMYAAIRELTREHGDISILFADDSKEHLDGAREAVSRFNAGNHFSVVLSTIEMSREFRTAQNEVAKRAYKQAISEFRFKTQLKIFEKKRNEIMLKDEKYDAAFISANECFKALEELSDSYFNNIITYEEFKNESNQVINKARPVLSQHRGYKEILGNLALAIAGLGVIYLAAGLINVAATGNFFFFKTDSEEKLDELQKAINRCNAVA